jgi:hypothetical protein
MLRGISFHGAGVGFHGINVTQVGSLYVEHCSISEFLADGVATIGGGNVWVKGSDVRSCLDGLSISSSSVPANLVVQDSSFSECEAGVVLNAFGAGPAMGLVSNCSATLCGAGFAVDSDSPANAEMTLTNCRAFLNDVGVKGITHSTGNATVRLGACVVINNTTAINKSAQGSGVISVLVTAPGTNLVSGNTNGNGLGGTAVSLQ